MTNNQKNKKNNNNADNSKKRNDNNSKKNVANAKTGKPNNLYQLLAKYRKTDDISARIKMISKLDGKDKNKFISMLTAPEIAEYKEKASSLIERRYAYVMKHRACLQALCADEPNIKLIKKKYGHLDISIPVYTIKAIINAYEGIGFSRDDGSGGRHSYLRDDHSYSSNAKKYYRTCIWYWERIICRWDTDTGVLSKEEIENREFTEYHINANKVKTIIPQLERYTKKCKTNPRKSYSQKACSRHIYTRRSVGTGLGVPKKADLPLMNMSREFRKNYFDEYETGKWKQIANNHEYLYEIIEKVIEDKYGWRDMSAITKLYNEVVNKLLEENLIKKLKDGGIMDNTK